MLDAANTGLTLETLPPWALGFGKRSNYFMTHKQTLLQDSARFPKRQKRPLKHLQQGSRVNLEVDVIARYLERLILGDKAAKPQASSNVTMAMLAENGFLR